MAWECFYVQLIVHGPNATMHCKMRILYALKNIFYNFFFAKNMMYSSSRLTVTLDYILQPSTAE